MSGPEPGLRSVVDADCAVDVGEVCFHGLFADVECVRDLLVGEAFGDEREYFAFTFGQGC